MKVNIRDTGTLIGISDEQLEELNELTARARRGAEKDIVKALAATLELIKKYCYLIDSSYLGSRTLVVLTIVPFKSGKQANE